MGFALALLFVAVAGQSVDEHPCLPEAEYVADVGCVTPTKLVRYVAPKYPRKAKKASVEGSVIVQCKVTLQGVPAEIEALKTEPPDYGFAAAATRAFRKWRFTPAESADGPIELYHTTHVRFSLDQRR